MKSTVILSLIILFGIGGFAFKEQKNHKIGENVQVYILMGQSNMAGRGAITEEYKTMQNERVLMLTKDNTWVTAKHPLHFDKPQVVGVGPGLSFGMAIANAYPADTIALVPCAVGGTSITKWEPGAYDEATKTHPYDDALIRIKEAMKKGEVKGIIWLQGEADSDPLSLANYLDKLALLIERVRSEVHNPNLPFVAGELGRYRESYQLFNKQLVTLPFKVSHTDVVTSENLWHKGDTTHFDSASATEYGFRFANGMLKLLKQ